MLLLWSNADHSAKTFKELELLLKKNVASVLDENRVLVEHGGKARKEYEKHVAQISCENNNLKDQILSLQTQVSKMEKEVYTEKRLRELEMNAADTKALERESQFKN